MGIMDLHGVVDPMAEPCQVCGDKSTGTHYGTVSCNGCKGFFRRTILRNQKFTCRFNKNCVIDKNFRCACRFCRFQKCLSAGMKREAIQFERDSIGPSAQLPSGGRKRKHGTEQQQQQNEDGATSEQSGSPGPENYRPAVTTTTTPSALNLLLLKQRSPKQQQMLKQKTGGSVSSAESCSGSSPPAICADIIATLLDMETRVNQEMSLRYRNLSGASGSVFSCMDGPQQVDGNGTPSAFSSPSGTRPVSMEDLNEISRTTLLLMVEWAKGMQPFPELSMEDKVILLKNYAPQHLILMPAFRSPDTTRLCLFNNSLLGAAAGADQQQGGMDPQQQQQQFGSFAAFKAANIMPRVLDEIVWPMRQLEMREDEFVCLKALAFLHPEAKGLTQSAQSLIRQTRNKILKALFSIILASVRPEEAPTRYGNILLLAPALKALTQLLIENMTLTKFFGLAEVDSLLSEFILDDLGSDGAGPPTAPKSIKEQLNSSSAPSFSTIPSPLGTCTPTMVQSGGGGGGRGESASASASVYSLLQPLSISPQSQAGPSSVPNRMGMSCLSSSSGTTSVYEEGEGHEMKPLFKHC